MRPLMRTLLGTLLAIAVLAPATAGAQPTNCGQIRHKGYAALGITEEGMGCANARDLAKHVIEHGCAHLEHFECSRTVHHRWNLRHRTDGATVTFVVRPIPPDPSKF